MGALQERITSTKNGSITSVHMGNVVDFSGSDGSLAGDTIEVNRGLETLIRESVLDVFWMHHRWKSVDRFAPQDKKTAALLENIKYRGSEKSSPKQIYIRG